MIGERRNLVPGVSQMKTSSMLNPPKYQPSTSLLLHTGLSALRTRTTVLLNRPLSQQHLDPLPLPRLQEPVMCLSHLRPFPTLTSIVVLIRGVFPLLLVCVRPQEVKFTILELKRKKNWPMNKTMRQKQCGSCFLMISDFRKQSKTQKIIKIDGNDVYFSF